MEEEGEMSRDLGSGHKCVIFPSCSSEDAIDIWMPSSSQNCGGGYGAIPRSPASGIFWKMFSALPLQYWETLVGTPVSSWPSTLALLVYSSCLVLGSLGPSSTLHQRLASFDCSGVVPCF